MILEYILDEIEYFNTTPDTKLVVEVNGIKYELADIELNTNEFGENEIVLISL